MDKFFRQRDAAFISENKMTPRLIDAHTHTQFAAFEKDGDAVIRRALGAGIWMINVGTQRDTSANSLELAHKYDGVWATVGLHPIHTEKSFHDEQELGITNHETGEPTPQPPSQGEGEKKRDAISLLVGGLAGFTSRGEDFDYDYYKKLAQDSKVVAIGECGLDYYRLTEETKNKQVEVFIKQIELAREVGKPLMIHCREAFTDLIEILEKHLIPTPQPPSQGEGGASGRGGRLISPGVVHFFSGTIDDAEKLMDLGFSFSFGGVITFARAYEKLIKFIPLDRILLETDAPYVAPLPYRGKRNEPLYVEEVAKKIAKILNKDFEEIARITTENAIKIFGLK